MKPTIYRTGVIGHPSEGQIPTNGSPLAKNMVFFRKFKGQNIA